MPIHRRFAIQSLIVTVVLNTILLVAMYVLLGDAIQASNQAVLLFAVGAVLTLLLWLGNYFVGRRLLEAAPTTPSAAETASRAVPAVPAPAATLQAQSQTTALDRESGAVQMLAILQRQGRLIDFLHEDLHLYDDAQIGAAVRTIHEGSRHALAEHVKLDPVLDAAEGSTVTVPSGFDPHEIRLTGDVVGEPPFRGELRHRGWRVVSIDLPNQAGRAGGQRIVAAAEVEVRR